MMPRHYPCGMLAAAALAVALTVLSAALPSPIAAKVTTWTNASPANDLWSNAGNWNNGVPVDFDDVRFSAIGGTSRMDVSGLMLNSLDMTGYSGTLTCDWGLDAMDVVTAGTVLLDANALAVASDLVVTGTLDAVAATISVGGGLSVSGTLDAGGYAVMDVWGSVSGGPGAVFNMGSTYLSAGGHVSLASCASVTWAPGGMLSLEGGGNRNAEFAASGVTLWDVGINRASAGDVTFFGAASGSLIINGDLNVSRGTMELAGGDLTVAGATGISANGALNGTASSGNIYFEATVAVRGDFSYTKPGGRVSLAAGTGGKLDARAGGSVMVVGQPLNRVRLEQDGVAGGTQWILEFDGTSTLAFDGVRVEDSDAQGPAPATATNSQDGGNNTNWNFGPKTTKWTDASPAGSDWSDWANWDAGVPGSGDVVLFSAVGGTSMMDIPGLMLDAMNMTGYTGTLTLAHTLQIATGNLVCDGTMELGGNGLAVAGDVVVAGTLDASGGTMSVGADLDIVGEFDCDLGGLVQIGGSIGGSTGAVLIGGTGTIMVGGDANFSNFAFVACAPGGSFVFEGAGNCYAAFHSSVVMDADLEITKASGSDVVEFTCADPTLTIGGDLIVNSGTVTFTGCDLEIRGLADLKLGGRLEGKVSSGDVTFEGGLVVRGEFDYKFPGGVVRILDGPKLVDARNGGKFKVADFTLSSIRIEQDGVAGGDQWRLQFDLSSTIEVNGVELQDSYADGPHPLPAPNCTDLGNNTNWLFGVSGAGDDLPRRLSVSAWPNPFNPSTAIRYATPRDGMTTVRIYDAAGSLVRTLVAEHRRRGVHAASWNGRNDAGGRAASGVYFCRVESGGEAVVGKLVLMQ